LAGDFQRFLEQLVMRYGLWRVVLAPYSLVPVLSGLGIVFDLRLAVFLGSISLTAVSFVLIVWLSYRLRVERHVNQDLERVTNNYAEIMLSTRPVPFQYELWEEYIVVGRGGDAVIEQYLTIRVVKRTKPVHIVWVKQHQSSRLPMSDLQHRRVSVTARRFAPFAEHGRRHGAGHITTLRWEAGNKLCAMIHLDEPLQFDDLVHLHLRWIWPGYFRELVRGGRDVIDWRVPAGITGLACSLTFREDCGLREGLDLTPYAGTPIPRYHATREGRITISLDYKDATAGRKLGLHLDATRNRAD
jgi:hypothetical protein